ncbi:hypothetical protein M153_12200001180 [Pseudoloma neurophilia]|uniref:Uncharacterized protein n=1 Tax=Pseudoloma neurophilia TaxID=146866 RepID=A0A0R0LV24_9MICR|nr:hypothetical protein M153_12200001180 [Pseudoloma neurophilia]
MRYYNLSRTKLQEIRNYQVDGVYKEDISKKAKEIVRILSKLFIFEENFPVQIKNAEGYKVRFICIEEAELKSLCQMICTIRRILGEINYSIRPGGLSIMLPE